MMETQGTMELKDVTDFEAAKLIAAMTVALEALQPARA